MTLLLDVVDEGRWFVCVRRQRDPRKKTAVYELITKAEGLCIAEVRWYSPWRKYSLFPRADTVWEATCLAEIATLLTSLTQARRRAARAPQEEHDDPGL